MSFRILRSSILLVFFFFAVTPVFSAERLRDLSMPLPADLRTFTKIRILVEQDRPKIQVSAPAVFEVLDDQGRVVTNGPKLNGATVRPVDKGIQWWTRIVPTRFLVVRSIGSGIRVGSKGVYRDEVFIYKNAKGKLDVVNRLKLDDYLKGVIPFEGNPAWALESLKAQAVVSRTFALTRMIAREKEEYDVSSGVISQVYAGKEIENAKTNEAVDATRGEILLYKGKIFPAYFHSTCGGATTAADLVWKVKPHPALSGVECKFCQKSPHYKREAVVTSAEIKEKLAKEGMPVDGVLGIRTDKIDRTGRAHQFVIQSTWAEKRVDADGFRVWIDPMRLKSNMITKIRANDAGAFVFKGKGWGHGVGMCQYGMKYLGELGYGYREILSYYYPGAQASRLKELEG
ncbi:MAG TPA: SpoIID/LytB domain-containing protein [Candidatus Omnitrophota bacterium]|nr:SpoIID/LytB domain-containing protein [Candidatus Omnitrophota bacterium]